MLVYENNRSKDNTREIIQKLIDEGLPIFFADEVEVKRYVHAKPAITKLAVSKYDADLVIPLDADEFLTHTSGINPRDVLESLHEDVEYQAPWRTYVYEKDPDIGLGFLPNNFSHYRNPALDVLNKAIASKALINEKQACFIPGAHFLEYPYEYQGSIPIEVHPELRFSHFPIRSKTQLLTKVIPNWICKWREPFPVRGGDGFQLGDVWDELKENGDISHEYIKWHSLRYSVPECRWGKHGENRSFTEILPEIEDCLTIEGRMGTAFCEDKLKLRYTDYGEMEKTLMRSTLTEYELSLASLPKREWETIRMVDDLKNQIDELNRHIEEVYNSRTWKFGKRLQKVYRFIVPW